MAEANPTIPPPPNPDPEAPAPFGPRPEGWPADAPWPPPAEAMVRDSGIREPTSTPDPRPSGLLNPEPKTQNPLFPVPAAGPVLTVDPATLEPHPYADLLPLMTEAEYRGLREAIRMDGQQVPGVMYAGKLLDGRNRCRACRELGIPFQVQPFGGTDQDALTYVLSVNQHRRNLNKSQRGAVATDLMPLLSEGIQQRRAERISAARLAGTEGEIRAKLPGSESVQTEEVRARAIAASIMGVSDRYVGDAFRLQREDPAAFAQVRAGKMSLSAALKRLGTASGAAAKQAARVRGLRCRVNELIKRAATDPALLAKLEQAIATVE